MIEQKKDSEKNYLAAMAVFQQMYDSKKNISDIISAFIKYYILSEHYYSFLLEDICKNFNEFYNFNLPIAIVKSALRKLNEIVIKKDDGHYIVDTSRLSVEEKENIIKNNIIYNDKIIFDLEDYLQEKLKRNLTKDEKNEVLDCLCDFLIGNTNHSKFENYISTYILKVSEDNNVKQQLEDISEGLVIYNGITSELDFSKLGSWKTKLTLYLDMEILFHIAGYNGVFFKNQANDFISLVKDINKKEKFVTLKYFDKVKKEIDKFFNSAEEIVEGKNICSGTVAMEYLVNGCSVTSDIIKKKSQFYAMISTMGIECDEIEYFANERNHRYCLFEDFDPTLSFINILRKGDNEKPIQNIKFLLITGTRLTLKQGYLFTKRNNIKKQDAVSSQKPLAESLEYITKLFWFTLNKSFGKSSRLASFDVVHKSKIVLASTLNNKVKETYDKLNVEFLDGKLTKDSVIYCIDELRKRIVLPENIENDKASFVLNLIESSDIESICNEKAIKDQELKEVQRNNLILQDNLKESNAENLRLKKIISDKEQYEKKEVYKKNAKKKILSLCIEFSIKTAACVCIVLFFLFLINKVLIPLIPGNFRWMTLIGWISSVITVITLLFKLLKNKIWKQYKDAIDKNKEFIKEFSEETR